MDGSLTRIEQIKRAAAWRPRSPQRHFPPSAEGGVDREAGLSPLLNVVFEAFPESLTREELAERAGASPLSSNVSRLSSLGLIGYPIKGSVVAVELLFPGRCLQLIITRVMNSRVTDCYPVDF